LFVGVSTFHCPPLLPCGRLLFSRLTGRAETCKHWSGLSLAFLAVFLTDCLPLSMADAADAARLTSKQRAHLRSLAHALDPVVRVGKDGLTEAVIAAAEEAFNTRELLKARVLDAAGEDVRDVAHALAEQLDDVQVVQVIGHVAILYRPDPDAPQIELLR